MVRVKQASLTFEGLHSAAGLALCFRAPGSHTASLALGHTEGDFRLKGRRELLNPSQVFTLSSI